MRRTVMLSLGLLSACASSKGEPGSQPRTETIRIVGSGSNIQLTTVASDVTNVATVQLPLDQVWSALPIVYESLAIPVTHLDNATHVIGNPSFKVRRRIGDVPLTRYFDCGSTQGGPNAETYELHLSVHTQAQQGESGTTIVSTAIQAVGRPVNFAAEPVRCTSKGALELRIVDTLKQKVQPK